MNTVAPQEGPFRQGICAGTVHGIVFMGVAVREFSSLDNNVRRELCINEPATATIDQLVRIVIAYIEAHPARMHQSFRALALEALRAASPCN